MRKYFFSFICVWMLCLPVFHSSAQSCMITCPSNITVSGTSASGAVVNYNAPTTSGDCGTITSLPASGSTFPIGTTTVNVYKNANQIVYALSGNALVTFNVADPSVVSSPLTITGLQSGETIRAIDFRVTDGKLFGVGVTSTTTGSGWVGRLYTINITSGAASQVGSETFPLTGGFLVGPYVSIDIEPTTDMIRLVTDDDLNMRINPSNGAYTVDGVLDPSNRAISAIAYSNNIPLATTTTLYDIGFGTQIPIASSTFFIQDPNKGTLIEVGTTGLPSFNNSVGFDISQTGTPLASAGTTLYSVNLVTGRATSIGTIGVSVQDISIAPISFITPSCSFTVTVNPSPPTVTINKAATQFDPATGGPVRFTVVFNEDVTGFDASDISFTGSTVPGTLVATVTGSGTTYTVEVNGIMGAGNVVASVNANAAVNNDGLSSLASTSTDNVVLVLVFQHDLRIIKTASSPYVNAGNAMIYTITVVRILLPGGPVAPLQNVVVNDVLPVGTTFLGLIPVFGNTATPFFSPPTANNNALSLFFPLFQVGEVFTLKFQVRVDAAATGNISNTATVGGPLGDVDPTNNSATAIVQISVPPTITCPGNITANTDPGKCFATVNFSEGNTVTVTGTPAPIIKYKIVGENGSKTVEDLSSFPESVNFDKGVNTITVTATNSAGASSCNFVVTVLDKEAPVVECPSNITVNNDAGKCSASVEVRYPINNNCYGTINFSNNNESGSITTDNIILGLTRLYPVGINTVTTVFSDDAGNSSTCSFTVTVVDVEKPVITQKPADVTVECTSQIPAVNTSSVMATDNCGTPTISHVGDVISNQTCANRYTLTRTYRATDASGNTATASQIITVDDKTPPTITGLTPSKRVLAPPNHKMVDVTLAYTVNDNCVGTPNVTVTVISNEPINGTGDGDTDPDWEIIDKNRIRLRAERAGNGTGRIYTITVTVNDGCSAPVSASTEVMVVHNITAPHSGNSFKVGSTVAFAGEFWDVPGNKHTAKWSIDGVSVSGVVTEPVGSKNGKVTGSYKFTTPGVYKLQMNVTDQKGVTTYANTAGDLEAIVVIYDPNGGYTYGGGYYNSPAGALVASPSQIGKASYGFTMNYFKNATNPKGETQFEFKVGEFEFNALNFEYLVISNSMAQFKGTGKITGGQSGIAFTMTVVDGQLDGTGVDKIRMKIYGKNGKVIYDNQPGASDAALPTAAVGTNSVIVIQGTNANPATTKTTDTQYESESKPIKELTATVYPNPANDYFNIVINSNDVKERITMQVTDMYGRVMEARNITVNSTIRLGDRYRPGTYFVRMIQGKQHKEIKLVKLPG